MTTVTIGVNGNEDDRLLRFRLYGCFVIKLSLTWLWWCFAACKATVGGGDDLLQSNI
ncbi:hypothetical protein Hanom_Chr13g01224671 [Helianthus anomalus]